LVTKKGRSLQARAPALSPLPGQESCDASGSSMDYSKLVRNLREGLGHVLRGKANVVDFALIGIFAGGHVLLEDVPGVGKTTLANPSYDDGLAMLCARQKSDPLEEMNALCTKNELLAIQESVRSIEVKQLVARYLLAIVEATRNDEDLTLGVSPRGSLALFRGA